MTFYRLLIQAKYPFTVVYTNAAFSDFTGLSSENIIGKNIDKFLPTDSLADILTCDDMKNQHVVTLDPSGGNLEDGCHGNCYIECSIKIVPINASLPYLLMIFSKRSEQQDIGPSFEVDLFSDIDLVSIGGDESADPSEPFSLVG